MFVFFVGDDHHHRVRRVVDQLVEALNIIPAADHLIAALRPQRVDIVQVIAVQKFPAAPVFYAFKFHFQAFPSQRAALCFLIIAYRLRGFNHLLPGETPFRSIDKRQIC